MKPRPLMPAVAKMVNRPFAEKLQEAQYFIAHNIALYKTPAVAWSGGKDSTLVLWLCLKLKPDILTVFNNTGVEYPETVRFIHKLRDKWEVNLIETTPLKRFWDIVAVKGFMNKTKNSNGSHGGVCCADLKEYPMERAQRQYHIDALFTGVTAPESRQRQFTALRLGACYTYKKTGVRKVHPILWWTEVEVRQYHADMDIPLNPMYEKGCDRIGCMPCTAYKTWESQLSLTNPKLYRLLKLRKDKQYCMDMGSPETPPPSKAVKP